MRSAITLRSGKELEEAPNKFSRGHGLVSEAEPKAETSVQQQKNGETKRKELVQPEEIVIKPPFPERFAKSKKEKEAKEILETFRKVEVNIPLLDAIKQVPRYAKFLKELCTSKKKLDGYQRINMGENVLR